MNSSCIQGRQPQGEGNFKQKRLRNKLDKAKAARKSLCIDNTKCKIKCLGGMYDLML
ncbi:hypothetical protein AAG906_003952 [Vitis piasezkii]